MKKSGEMKEKCNKEYKRREKMLNGRRKRELVFFIKYSKNELFERDKYKKRKIIRDDALKSLGIGKYSMGISIIKN